MGREEEVSENIVVADTKEGCKAILRARYGTNFQIKEWKVVLMPRSLPFLKKKSQWQATYIIPPGENFARKAEEPRRNQDDDFKRKLETIQLRLIATKLDEISKSVESVSKISPASPAMAEHETLRKIREVLEANEFTPSYIQGVVDRVRSEFSLEALGNFDAVQDSVLDWIGEGIHVVGDRVHRPPQVVIIVGPTGVGKTTTLAKLAAKVVLAAKHAQQQVPVVRLITTDTMRVGALEMLSRYGAILKTGVDKAETLQDVKELYNRFKSSSDYIFIDTSGFSPKDYKHIAGMREVLDVPDMNADVYLAVAASTKAKDLETIMRNYEQFNFRSVILTKYDETSSYGNVLSVLSEKNKGISWITTGQQVPRYIERANPGRFLMDLDGFRKDTEHIKEKFNFKPDTTE